GSDVCAFARYARSGWRVEAHSPPRQGRTALIFAAEAPPGAFPILRSDRRWTTTTRLVPPPRGAGHDGLPRAHRRSSAAAPERVLRGGRVRPGHGAPNPHHRAPRPGEPA